MSILDALAESKIREALAKGELSGLAGEGKPLQLDDDALVDPALRSTFRILKNAGFLPPEVQRLKDLEAMIEQVGGQQTCASQPITHADVRLALDQLNASHSGSSGLAHPLVRARWYQAWRQRLANSPCKD